MPSAHLNQVRVNTLKPGSSAYEFRDAELKGLGVRVLPTGRIRCFIHSQHRGRRIRKIVGGDEIFGPITTVSSAWRHASRYQAWHAVSRRLR